MNGTPATMIRARIAMTIALRLFIAFLLSCVCSGYDRRPLSLNAYNRHASSIGMRSLVSAALIAFAMQAAAQLLTCPPPSSQATRACELFHYHVALFRPDPRGFAEVWGTNQFASQAACDRARDAAMKRNLAVVDHMKRVAGDNNFEPDRFGPCHCDGSVEPSMPTFLNDAQRLAQMR